MNMAMTITKHRIIVLLINGIPQRKAAVVQIT
jgi:hypothetical protein